ncbi:MAG: hypothetical protein ABL879_15045 [Devosia sp.]
MRNLIATIRALLLLPVLAAAIPVSAADFVDQQALDNLFIELRQAPDANAAEAISQTIWAFWVNPTDRKLADEMAVVLRAESSGDFATGIGVLDKMISEYPSYAEGWNRRATLRFMVGNYKGSLEDIDKVLALEPRHFGALSGKIMIELRLGDRPAALKDMVAALAIHPYLSMKELFPELQQKITNI